ncbi:SDR family oxidoreductase [Klebsiella michiganensis]|uniref:SDR family oxidoreductase n=1 Tax=Klebsiella michiganensis TaxID=1134687 RepID=UPI002570DF30|nr:SDR family oxidoreductase [Klebsiella michiganensis]MDL4454755.1 SDR family oxidoreductase [Klebsiella michiganensis]
MPCKLKVILTGASGLIGCAIANEFQQSEIKIVLAGKNKKKLQDTYLNREKFGGYYFWSGDLSDDKACRELVAYAVQHMGGVDILINCAGVFNFFSPKDTTYSQMFDTLNINLLAPIYLSHLVLPYLRASSCPIIINISSIAGSSSLPDSSCYAASKWGLNGFTYSFRAALRKERIPICNISPSQIETLSQHSVSGISSLTPQDIAAAVMLVLTHVKKTGSSIDLVL